MTAPTTKRHRPPPRGFARSTNKVAPTSSAPRRHTDPEKSRCGSGASRRRHRTIVLPLSTITTTVRGQRVLRPPKALAVVAAASRYRQRRRQGSASTRVPYVCSAAEVTGQKRKNSLASSKTRLCTPLQHFTLRRDEGDGLRQLPHRDTQHTLHCCFSHAHDGVNRRWALATMRNASREIRPTRTSTTPSPHTDCSPPHNVLSDVSWTSPYRNPIRTYFGCIRVEGDHKVQTILHRRSDHLSVNERHQRIHIAFPPRTTFAGQRLLVVVRPYPYGIDAPGSGRTARRCPG